MEHSIIVEFYKDYYYPTILLDSGLKVVYKNAAAYAVKMKPRTGVHIKKYLNEENLKILRKISDGKTDRCVVELKKTQDRCLARFAGGMIALIFFDSLNYIRDYKEEKAEQINQILAEYKEQEFLCIDERDGKKMQKIRAYLRRHIANMKKTNYEKNYCNIWEFINHFGKGVSLFIKNLGYTIAVKTDEKDKMFIYELNESDFLTLNFILLSYALSSSVFGNLNIKFDSDKGAVIYEFIPVSNSDKSKNIDLELAALIAENNKLKLEFHKDENNMNHAEEKTQIWVRFISPGKLSQLLIANNIMDSKKIAVRAKPELAFLQPKLK